MTGKKVIKYTWSSVSDCLTVDQIAKYLAQYVQHGWNSLVRLTVIFSSIKHFSWHIRLLVQKAPLKDTTELLTSSIYWWITESLGINAIDDRHSHDCTASNKHVLRQHRTRKPVRPNGLKMMSPPDLQMLFWHCLTLTFDLLTPNVIFLLCAP